MGVTSDVGISVSVRNTGTMDLSTPVDTLLKSYGLHLEAGAGAGKADRVFHDQRTIAASGSETLDLAGSLADSFGAAQVFARVKAIIFKAAAGNTNNVIIGANGSADFIGLLNAAGTITLRPGMAFAAFASSTDATGMAVTATTADLIKVANSGGTTGVTYDVIIVGNST
ncbi:hypothetical protein [Streptomyces sp. NBC_01565]|uniref:hypothetical protein n=1 Tax=Streptomyces sp. NBC_01565 TaxID=2975881 RepID=UPI00224F1CAA|nr:hypothetical protein [Streptomyces sp. NBC_01565]MCX4540495.1 hypothetical protein [Streptomyces sp. NBC_01565]